jgi:hypothetical protein
MFENISKRKSNRLISPRKIILSDFIGSKELKKSGYNFRYHRKKTSFLTKKIVNRLFNLSNKKKWINMSINNIKLNYFNRKFLKDILKDGWIKQNIKIHRPSDIFYKKDNIDMILNIETNRVTILIDKKLKIKDISCSNIFELNRILNLIKK